MKVIRWEITENQKADAETTAYSYTKEQQEFTMVHIIEFDVRQKQFYGHENLRKYMNTPQLWASFTTVIMGSQEGVWNNLSYKRLP